MKPELKFENGKLIANAATSVDTDKDGVAALTASVVVSIDAAEAVTEIAKKDLPWLKAIIEKLG